MNKAAPKMAQFTAMSGKKIPSALYKTGLNFSTSISTICVMAAITAMNEMKIRKLRSVLGSPTHARAPFANKKCLTAQHAGVQMSITKTTANPNPNAVSIFFEQAM